MSIQDRIKTTFDRLKNNPTVATFRYVMDKFGNEIRHPGPNRAARRARYYGANSGSRKSATKNKNQPQSKTRRNMAKRSRRINRR